jgi:D-lyxose ketol-isomerase
MKRSKINGIMRAAVSFFREQNFRLPPFAYWTPEVWRQKGPEAAEIVQNGLGWDITDYGLDHFERYGLLLFTLRNGDYNAWAEGRSKPYCEKVMIAEIGQEHQMHCHNRKVEDIINRGGGLLAIQFYNATDENDLAESEVRVQADGVTHAFPAGQILRLAPGESVTIHPRLFHKFWAEGERVLMGEVSTINDDREDNFFYRMIGTGRFSAVEEDTAPLYPLFSEVAAHWGAAGG